MPPPLLEIRNLSVSFGGVPAVKDVSLRIEAGETFGLVGESGSGKSVTSLALMRLLPPEAVVDGSISLADSPEATATCHDLLRLSEASFRRLRGRRIAMIFQDPMTALNPVMRVGKQVMEALRAHQPTLSRTELRDRTLAALEEVALPDPIRRMHDFPHEFSGGQRQRIMIAIALANRPALLIADEPTTALDVTVQAQVLDLLRSIQRTHRLAMLFISHDLAVVRQVAHTVAVMENGRIVEQARSDVLFEHPQHPYTRRLLASIPTMSTDRTQPLARHEPGIWSPA